MKRPRRVPLARQAIVIARSEAGQDLTRWALVIEDHPPLPNSSREEFFKRKNGGFPAHRSLLGIARQHPTG